MKDFSALWDKAHAAGMAAGTNAVPEVMRVTDGVNVYVEPEGPCGFAWVVCSGREPIARWAKLHKGARPEYGGGTCLVWVSEFNQSLNRKQRYADAFVRILRDNGIDANARSRMD